MIGSWNVNLIANPGTIVVSQNAKIVKGNFTECQPKQN